MKSFLSASLAMALGMFFSFTPGIRAAETNIVRIGIGPFFAAAGDQQLAQAAAALPDLLTTLLSQDNRFQLVERERINTVWSELHLTQAGLASADTVAQLGKVLSCDWLVSGSLIQSEAGPQVWIKVIDTPSGVVLDLQSLPYNATNFSATIASIAHFLTQARVRGHPREFIAMDRFEDRSASSVTLEDWTPRLTALIGKHFLEVGYGVVERELVAPIFSEYQLQSAGAMADASRRVKLQPAFWVVGGSWKWVTGPENKINVTISVEKMGGGEQLLSVSKLPNAELEKAVVDAIQNALKASGSLTDEKALAAEENFRSEHFGQVLEGREGAQLPSRFNTNMTSIIITNPRTQEARQMTVDPNFLAQQAGHKAEYLKTLKQAILLNPKDMKSKFFLGRALFRVADPVESKQGQDLLEEVAASSDAMFASRARNWLDDIHSGKITLQHDAIGGVSLATHGQPASLPGSAPSVLSAWEAKLAVLNEITNVASQAAAIAKIPAFLPAYGSIGSLSAAKLWRNKLFIADGANLQCFDTDTKTLTDVLLPRQWKHAITALEADENGLWLGSGDGLFRVTGGSGTVREYGSKDGLPAGGVSALQLSGGKLFMGTGSERESMIGWLDLGTDKFTDVGEPFLNTLAIVTPDAKTLWISSVAMLQKFDVSSRTLTKALPEGFRDHALTHRLDGAAVAINSKYLAILMPERCVGVYSLEAKQWKSVNISTNETKNQGESLAFDPANPDWIWIGGGSGEITLLNLATSQILAEGEIAQHWTTGGIFATSNSVVFLELRLPNGYDLYCLDKAKLFGTEESIPPAKSPPNETKSVAARSDQPLRMKNPEVIAYLNDGGMTAFGTGRIFGKGALIVACGTKLKTFDWTGTFGLGSGTDFEPVNLPLKIEHPITAIANDGETALWLGTDGGGLIRVPQSGAAPTVIDEREGLPMSSITSLRLTQSGKLMIGFGHGRTGALGCLDTATLKFTELMSPAAVFNNWEDSLQPAPLSPVEQIKTEDEANIFWIASDMALYRLKLDSRQFTKLLPSHELPDFRPGAGLRTLSVMPSGFAATTLASGSIAFCKLPDNQWTHLNLSANPGENATTTLAFDDHRPNNLWIGGRGKITILDVQAQKIISECKLARPGDIEVMFVFAGDAFFVGDDPQAGSYELYHLENPAETSGL